MYLSHQFLKVSFAIERNGGDWWPRMSISSKPYRENLKMAQGFQVWRRPSSSKHLWDQRIAQDLSGAAKGGIFGEISSRLVELENFGQG